MLYIHAGSLGVSFVPGELEIWLAEGRACDLLADTLLCDLKRTCQESHCWRAQLTCSDDAGLAQMEV